MSHCGWHVIARKSPAKRAFSSERKTTKERARRGVDWYAASLLGSKKGEPVAGPHGGMCRQVERANHFRRAQQDIRGTGSKVSKGKRDDESYADDEQQEDVHCSVTCSQMRDSRSGRRRL